MYKCPFCSSELEVKEGGKLVCDTCKLHVDLHNRYAYTLESAPKYVKETLKLLKTVLTVKPAFVVGKYHAFDTHFSMDDVILSGKTDYVPDSYKLIAGNTYIAKNLFDYVAYSILCSAQNNPLIFTKDTTVESILYTQVILSSVAGNLITEDIRYLTNLYLHPLLEYKVNYMLGGRQAVGDDRLTDEQVLYALLTEPPHVNIVWSCNIQQLEENICKFTKACLKDVEYIDYRPENNDSDYEELLKYAQAGTLVNRINGPGSYYDVFNHTVLTQDVDRLRKVDWGPKILMNIYKQLADLTKLLFFKNDKLTHKFGLEAKRKCLLDDNVLKDYNNVDELVVDFWKLMAEKVKNKISE